MMTPVILAGGNGVRLWPLSRRARPKQFISLEDDRSLLARTLLRLEGLSVAPPIVICQDAHRFLLVCHAEAGCNLPSPVPIQMRLL